MLYALTALLCVATGVAEQSTGPAGTDRLSRIQSTAPAVARLFEDHVAENHLPGLAYAIVADGTLVYAGGFGNSDLDEETPAGPKTMFRIASMSKSFTALAILQLRDAGKLRLDEAAETYLPELKGIAYPTTDSPRITVRNLMTHSAGFPEDNPWGDRQLDDTDRELQQLVEGGISFSRAPGIAFEYSNLGFALLGQIVQRVSGMPFTQYMSEHVFEPLGMKSTVYEYADVPPGRLALGYGWRDDEWFEEPLLHHGAYGAMGGLITSVEDFSRYVALHLSAWPARSDADDGPLRRSSLREMHQPRTFTGVNAEFTYADGRKCPMASAYAYGLGWRSDCEGRVYLSHSGGLPGFGSNWTMMPDYDLAVVSFDNRTYAGTSVVNLTVLDTIVSAAGLEPRPVPVSEVLDRRKNALVKILPEFEDAESSGLFAENFFLDMPLALWRDRARTLFAGVGEVSSVGSMQAENRLRGSFLLHGEQGDLKVYFTLTPEHDPLIQELRITAQAK